MLVFKKFAILLFLATPIVLCAQSEIIFNGILLEDSFEKVKQKITEISETSDLISITNPTFPLAKVQEDHFVCTNVKTENGLIENVVFTFADNKLAYIEARGNSYKTFTSKRKDTARTYMDYEIYLEDKLFLKKENDIAWIMTENALHVNLFTWENPYLKSDGTTNTDVNHSSKIPAFLKMGASMNDLKPALDSNSDFIRIEELDGSDPSAQLQINCFGVTYLGFPRKIEARFGDNKLNVVWILTAKEEEDRIRKALINQYGKPIFINDDWEIFNNWQVALRKDKPEVLLMEEKIGLDYKTSYFKQ
ncbi:hypothetical protein J0X14_04865 [Muricauda sp. CAU 1633]|uniref:hypothetical protein n=1 Tax=Allomuricauda sp. CAU 1633 TaxID=2816036 RepID=UPI001A8E1CDA|nr:hypothetical protein [Muricauda sp. CAU 1633]MBO0321620.1 hypothetical protein [Muricauda sp. CAU 1633]